MTPKAVFEICKHRSRAQSGSRSKNKALCLAAYRGGNYCVERRKILKRGNFPHTVWELELQLQSALTKDIDEPAFLKQRLGDPEES
jgi:hypothetical protein